MVKSLGKIQDNVLLGLTAGFLGNIPKTILCLTLNCSGITKQKCSDLASGFFLPRRTTMTLKGTIFGILADFVMASLDGVVLTYFLIHTGKVTKRNALIKGFMGGQVSFALFRGIFSKIGTAKKVPKDILTNTVMSFNSSVWGVTTAMVILLLGDKSLFRKNPETPSFCNSAQSKSS